MGRSSKRIRDNRGFSLVELIVSILIMSVITGMVVILISSSQATYNEVNTEAVVQTETETVRSFVGELALEAQDCGYAEFPSATDATVTDCCIWFKAPDNSSSDASTDYYCYFLLLEKATNVVRYGRYKCMVSTVEGDGSIKTVLNPVLTYGDELLGAGFSFKNLLETTPSTKISGDPYCLLAQHVTSLKLSRSSNLITVEMKLDYNNASYTKNLIFAGRNM